MTVQVRLLVVASAIALTLTSLAPHSASALSPEEILQRVQDVAVAAQDSTSTQRMTLERPGGGRETRELVLYQRGTNDLLLRFTAPADIRGVGLLVQSAESEDERIYLYMPAFRRERRIAGHVKNDEFMGTDLTYEDIAHLDYTERYRADAAEETSDYYELSLIARPGSVSYASATMLVDKENYLPIETRLFRDGELVKTIRAEPYRREGGYWYAERMVVEDADTGHRTIVEVREIEHDQGLSDSDFSVRTLRRFR